MSKVVLGMRVRSWFFLVALVALAGFLAAEVVPRSTAAAKDPEPLAAPSSSGQAADYAKTLSKAFREAAGKVLPAVVAIQNRPPLVERTNPRGPSSDDEDFSDSPFGELFRNNPDLRRFFQGMPRGIPHGPSGEALSIGSGVIIDPAGVILTNNHVVDGAGKVVVRLADGREFSAAEIKKDPKTDLAIVRIKGASNLKAARLGDSEKMEVGDWVLALGDPFRLEGTVTAGIISAKERPLSPETRAGFLQTDASINPGSSGGPLINLDGEVIGINTAIHTRTGTNDGVGFAIPSNLAKWVSDQLVKTGSVKRAYLGVAIQTLTQQLADHFRLKVREGILVSGVRPDSPAAAAGLKAGDVITKFDGKPVGDMQQLVGMVDRSPIGESRKLEVVRDGKRQEISVTLREQPSDYGVAVRGPERSGRHEPAKVDRLGLQVEALTKEVADQLGLKAGEGVVVTEVAPGSLASRAGVATGDVITQVNRKPVRLAQDFKKALDAQPISKGVLLLIRTPEGSRFVVIRAED